MPALTQTFIDALHRLESERDVDTIANLFADNAEVSNPLVQYADGGQQAAKTFWGQYRDAFTEIRSDFRAVKETEGVSFLEWVSKGAVDNQSFEYGGVSVLEFSGDKISAFRTYFDSRQIPTAHKAGGQKAGQDASAGSNAGRVQLSGNTGTDNGKADNGEDSDMVQAQRDAAEQRAGGGYQ